MSPGKGWQSKHCRRLQGLRQWRPRGCEPEVRGAKVWSSFLSGGALDLGHVDHWVVQAMVEGSPSPCCWNLMLFDPLAEAFWLNGLALKWGPLMGGLGTAGILLRFKAPTPLILDEVVDQPTTEIRAASDVIS